MASLNRLLERPERRYLPGHGGAIEDGKRFTAGLAEHRREREQAILARLAAGDRRIADIVAYVYRDTDKRLHGAAALSVLAHLEALIDAGRVAANGPPSLGAEFSPA
jgi:hydroxyacylglutathione hydrolase